MEGHGKVNGLLIYRMDKVYIEIKMGAFNVVYGKWGKK
jgi:hypothetical protein